MKKDIDLIENEVRAIIGLEHSLQRSLWFICDWLTTRGGLQDLQYIGDWINQHQLKNCDAHFMESKKFMVEVLENLSNMKSHLEDEK